MSNVRRFSLAVATALAACAAIVPGAQATWSSASWTLPTTSSQLAGASCASTTFCVLTGYQSGGTPRGLSYKYNGTTYSSVVPAATTAELYNVTCTSTTFCMGVGTDYATSTPAPHAESFNGTSWTTVTSATPTGATFTELAGIACPSTTSCFAAGRFQKASGTTPLVETYSGTSFSQTTVTPPTGTTNSQLNAIACSATTACTAVGGYDSASPRTPLIFRYNGTTWATQTAAVPAGSTYTELTGVACPSATVCHAVGYYLDSLSAEHALAETWNGTAWSTRAVADPSGGQDASLTGISCYSTTGCEAVGSYTNSTNLNVEKLAAGWNGTAWSLQSDARPMSVTDAQLIGVGCVSSSFCRAVGVSNYDGTTGVTGLRPAIDVGP
ncbi:MAG TPA: hypothetical protein VFG42_24780 [Baekduia sp.]|uniref:hypothetical protein n=1 Tax=Baekduia sp. TaxID=2600305 RepID=UPI002D79ADB5|nr:hypothetical protein [Baekduia sp.]HET6510033.1 hypothetical protein [Baekduia sp.]